MDDHPEHDDGLVAEAQWVSYSLEMSKLDGLQKEQPVQDKPGEAETQQDKITVAQWLPPHQVPEIHSRNEGVDQDPTANSRTEKNRNAFPDFRGHRCDVSQSHHDAL